ncbi:hypothetical protein [Entomomonas asaccharolytica]|uniref:Carboxypeptidase regulatory-like domain-containing protein n=1 Tax=Entomomonas asaccharolytica TaxID=2785331 RepID=A0A974NCR2_9GAMM|nr:hypothetical protein [Entomomonas asaccharolytica]QQP84315.1 hypothetical protein JHT90_07700 [Entomomonas asaccharolytica]
MKNSLMIISCCLLLVACQNSTKTTNNESSIHPYIKGVVKKQGNIVPHVQVTLSSNICNNATVVTDAQGKFTLEQFCEVTDSGPGNILGAPTYLFDVNIVDGEKSFTWSVINPFDITVEFDLTEQMVCVTNGEESRCSNLVKNDIH